MSSSIMPLLKLARTIFIFTIITGIVFSNKPNTYWSKRTGQPEFSNFIHKDSQNSSEKTEMNDKNLTEYGTHQQIKTNGMLPLPFLSFSTFLRQIKYVLHNMNKD